MKIFKYSLAMFAIVLMAAAPSSSSVSPQQIAQNNNAFAFDLYREITQTQKGNVFFSPFSISTALAMTYAGADSNTATEMQKTMRFLPNNEDFHMSYGGYLQALEKNAKGNIKLQIANRLWGEKKYPLLPSFLEINEKAYNSPLEKVDFIHKPDASRVEINDWVADKTEQRIKDLIPEGSITTDTRLVLTNAIYFKGDWLYKFNKKKTRDRKFKMVDGDSKKVPFMNFEGAFIYHQTANYQMIKLPYKGSKQSMIVVLPLEGTSIEETEKLINQGSFQPLTHGYLPEVILSLPKFKMTLPLGLNAPLKNLGMPTAFTPAADFSKITGGKDLFISDVIHKAFIEIDEDGTEAAAATAVVMVTVSSIPGPAPKPIEFIADHPFLFYIIDDETQAILFMGRLMEPLLN